MEQIDMQEKSMRVNTAENVYTLREKLIKKSVDVISKQVREHEAVFDDRRLLGTIMGVVFEEIAIDYISRHPRLFKGGISEDVGHLLAWLRSKNKRNPDQIIYQKNELGGYTIDAILEIKLDSVDDTKYRASDQLRKFRSNILLAIEESYDNDQTQKIVLSEDSPIYLVHPMNVLRNYKDIQIVSEIEKIKIGERKYRDYKYLFIPVTKDTVKNIAREIQKQIVENLPEDVGYWIAPNEWMD